MQRVLCCVFSNYTAHKLQQYKAVTSAVQASPDEKMDNVWEQLNAQTPTVRPDPTKGDLVQIDHSANAMEETFFLKHVTRERCR